MSLLFYHVNLTQSELIKKAADGDKKAFETLMTPLIKDIYGFIGIYVESPTDIDDIVQETMIAVWLGIKNFGGSSSFSTWVFGITRRKISDHYRAKYRSPATLPLESALDAGEEDFSDSLAASLDLKNAVGALGGDEKEIIFLAFVAGKSYGEISEIMGIPVGTVKSRFHTIKAKLKKRLSGGEQND